MFVTNLYLYVSVGFSHIAWKPSWEFLWFKSTHFYHSFTMEDKEIPLNKQVSLTVDWLFFHVAIVYSWPFDEAEEEKS